MFNKAKKLKIVLAAVLSLMVLLSAGCAGSSTGAAANAPGAGDLAAKKVVTDVLGRKVEMSAEVKRIGVTPIPYASMIYAIDGSAKRLVAINPSAKKAYEQSILKKLAPEMADVTADYIGTDFSINIEEIINLKPDVMIVWSTQEAEISKLEGLGIPVVALSDGADSNIEEMRTNMRIIGQVLDKEQEAEKLIAYNADVEKHFQSKANQIDQSKKPKVLYIRDSMLKVAASKSFNQKMIELAGGVNVAGEVTGSWTQVTMEQILKWDPEIIYLSNFDPIAPADLYNNKIEGQNWSNVSAVKNKKVYKTPLGIYRWDAPNAETPLFLKWMGQKQQPAIFSDYNMENDLKSFYQAFFQYDLTQEDINLILKKGN